MYIVTKIHRELNILKQVANESILSEYIVVSTIFIIK